MSLDVYLNCACCDSTLFSRNITHNLNVMAKEVGEGFYRVLWRPEELGFETASQLQDPIYHGLTLLKSDRNRFARFNPDNGWGDYDDLVEFAERYLMACRKYPDAKVSVSR